MADIIIDVSLSKREGGRPSHGLSVGKTEVLTEYQAPTEGGREGGREGHQLQMPLAVDFSQVPLVLLIACSQTCLQLRTSITS